MTFGVACSLMASFTPAVMDLILRVQADYAGNSVPRICRCSTAAEMELREALDEIPGAQLERKHFSVAAHYRNVNENDACKVALAVETVAAKHRELRRMDGKKVYELLPDIDWNKGKAALWLLETLGLAGQNALPIYIGDDRTDEDAFRALEKRGVAILVSEHPQVTAANYWLNNPEEVERFLENRSPVCAA